MNIPNKYASYEKVKKVISSCKTQSHLKGARNMLENFVKMFPEETIYADALRIKELYKSKSIRNGEK